MKTLGVELLEPFIQQFQQGATKLHVFHRRQLQYGRNELQQQSSHNFFFLEMSDLSMCVKQ